MCVLGEKAVVLGREGSDPLAESKPLHLVGIEDTTIVSFGEPFGSYGPFAQIALSKGSLLCDMSKDEVIVTSRFYGEVRRYTDRLALQWAVLLTHFRRMEIVETGQSRVSLGIPEGDVLNEVVGLFVLGQDSLAVQVASKRRGFKHPDDHIRVETRFLSRQTGRLFGVDTSWPIVRVQRGNLIGAYTNVPKPEITLYEIRTTKQR